MEEVMKTVQIREKQKAARVKKFQYRLSHSSAPVSLDKTEWCSIISENSRKAMMISNSEDKKAQTKLLKLERRMLAMIM
jgi:hypothetical protein